MSVNTRNSFGDSLGFSNMLYPPQIIRQFTQRTGCPLAGELGERLKDLTGVALMSYRPERLCLWNPRDSKKCIVEQPRTFTGNHLSGVTVLVLNQRLSLQCIREILCT